MEEWEAENQWNWIGTCVHQEQTSPGVAAAAAVVVAAGAVHKAVVLHNMASYCTVPVVRPQSVRQGGMSVVEKAAAGVAAVMAAAVGHTGPGHRHRSPAAAAVAVGVAAAGHADSVHATQEVGQVQKMLHTHAQEVVPQWAEGGLPAGSP